MAVGDVNLAWQVGERISANGPQVPFIQVRQYFDEADLVLANLECSLSMAGDEWPGKEIHLAAPEGAVDSITFAGIDVVSVANNHSLDYGREGLVETLGILDRSGVNHAGGGANYASAHAPVIIELHGLRLALLSYVVPFSSKLGFNTNAWAARTDLPGVAIGTPDVVRADIAAAKHLADVVIVAVHSGGEFRRYPKNNQLALAEAAINAGAALVLGHGPHNLQGYVRGRNTLVAYSLGNFVFDQYTGRQNDSAILDVTLSAEGVESLNWLPIEIDDGIPRPAAGEEVDRIFDQLVLPPVRE